MNVQNGNIHTPTCYPEGSDNGKGNARKHTVEKELIKKQRNSKEYNCIKFFEKPTTHLP